MQSGRQCSRSGLHDGYCLQHSRDKNLCTNEKKQRTPSPKQKTPSPKQKTPSPKQKTPSPKQKTPSPTEEKSLVFKKKNTKRKSKKLVFKKESPEPSTKKPSPKLESTRTIIQEVDYEESKSPKKSGKSLAKRRSPSSSPPVRKSPKRRSPSSSPPLRKSPKRTSPLATNISISTGGISGYSPNKSLKRSSPNKSSKRSSLKSIKTFQKGSGDLWGYDYPQPESNFKEGYFLNEETCMQITLKGNKCSRPDGGSGYCFQHNVKPFVNFTSCSPKTSIKKSVRAPSPIKRVKIEPTKQERLAKKYLKKSSPEKVLAFCKTEKALSNEICTPSFWKYKTYLDFGVQNEKGSAKLYSSTYSDHMKVEKKLSRNIKNYGFYDIKVGNDDNLTSLFGFKTNFAKRSSLYNNVIQITDGGRDKYDVELGYYNLLGAYYEYDYGKHTSDKKNIIQKLLQLEEVD
jgi:hypothetical protein